MAYSVFLLFLLDVVEEKTPTSIDTRKNTGLDGCGTVDLFSVGRNSPKHCHTLFWIQVVFIVLSNAAVENPFILVWGPPSAAETGRHMTYICLYMARYVHKMILFVYLILYMYILSEKTKCF